MQQRIFYKRENSHKKISFNLLCKHIAFYSLLFVFKVLGLSPWKINTSKILGAPNQNGNQESLAKVSKYGSLYNILLIIILPAYLAMEIILAEGKDEKRNSNLVRTVQIYLQYYGILVIVGIWLNYVMQQKKIVNIVNGLWRIDNNLMGCNRYTCKSECRLYIIPLINFFLCGCQSGFHISFCGIHIASLWITPLIIGSWVLIECTLLLNIIFQLFESIDAKILDLGGINDINEENFYQTINLKVLLKESDIKDINCINFSIMQLCEIFDQIRDFYAIPTLMIIIYFITSTTFALYVTIVELFFNKLEFPMFGLDITTWILIIVFNVVVFTSNVTRITRKLSKIPHHICLLLHRCSMNLTIKEALFDLLRDISYRNLNFTAYGVITLDGFLLQTIIGTIITYLIILLQYRN
ncbi:uncharacterized protein LOC123267078 [Cotesia glomerata]|uniref:uncharacterized protein LOC123267078 n=1 Tax=Cotesia glomerata TaxID=32391 RepID=UPI001D03593B|nr:uncharacterized protein LOC123267078 [Cotesia glomerata]